MTVCLAMIVKDEEAVIERCLRSVMPMIDSWVIVDTGSQDNTPAIIEQTLKNVPGELHHREWNGFADARTHAMRLARDKADYTLMVDADMTLHGTIPGDLTAGAYYLRIGDRFSWRLPMIMRNTLNWRYESDVHNYLACDVPFTGEDLDTVTVTHHFAGRPRREKIEGDVKLLKKKLEEKPDDPRSTYYLAQSYRDLGDYELAAEWYEKRCHLKGWVEENFHARYREGQMRYRLGQWERAVWCLLEAWSYRPSRAEPLRSLAAMYRRRNVHAAADMFDEWADRVPMTTDRLFVETDAYKANRIDWDEWRANYDTWTFEQHQEFYAKVAKAHPTQRQWDADAVRKFLVERRPKHVADLGGWDGSLADLMLNQFDWIESWTNYDITDVPQVCRDQRYEQIVLDDWPWEFGIRTDALIASHVFEHMRIEEIELLLDNWDVRSVFIDTPLAAEPSSWNGYQGTHILEVGSTELIRRLDELGYNAATVQHDGRLVAFLDRQPAEAKVS